MGIIDILKDFFSGKKDDPKPAAAVQPDPVIEEAPREPEPVQPEPAPEAPAALPKLNEWHTFGDHLYRQPGDDPSIVFTSASGTITRTIVDHNGKIVDFPGIAPEAEAKIRQALKQGSLEPTIRFRTDFEMRVESGLILMIWQVQPDGMYWRDEDGYGITPDEEIRLYTLIDGEGRFTGPFRLYNIGRERFYP